MGKGRIDERPHHGDRPVMLMSDGSRLGQRYVDEVLV